MHLYRANVFKIGMPDYMPERFPLSITETKAGFVQAFLFEFLS